MKVQVDDVQHLAVPNLFSQFIFGVSIEDTFEFIAKDPPAMVPDGIIFWVCLEDDRRLGEQLGGEIAIADLTYASAPAMSRSKRPSHRND